MSQYGDFSKLLIPGGLPAIPTTFRTSAGDAIPALNVLTLTNGANITFSGAGSVITAALSGTTNHALQVGNVGGSLTSLAVGATGTVLCGVTGADPAFSATPTVTTVYAGTFDTNVAAAGLTLSGTTLSADGTDVDININITAKGAGKVIIDDLQLGTPLTVPYGGIGTNTLTDHGVVVGRGAAAIDALSVGATGTVLQGVTGADPTWSTATYPSTVALGDVLVASAANVIGVVNDVTNAGYVLTANAGAAPTFQAVPTHTLPADVPETFATDAGSATPAVHSITIAGGSNIGTTGAGSTVTIDLDSSPSVSGSLTAGTYITATAGDLTLTDGDAIISNRDAATTSPIAYFKKNRSGAALTTGDLTGTLKFSGYDGTQYTDSARITSTSSGTIASTRVAGNLQFYTHPDSAAADPTLRMTIASTGATTIAAPDSGVGLTVSGGGITCSSGAIAASSGAVSASSTVTAGTNLIATSGNLNFTNFSYTTGGIQYNGNQLLSFHSNNTAPDYANILIGYLAGKNGMTFPNICLGFHSGNSLTTGGSDNFFAGMNTARYVTSGKCNVIIGSQEVGNGVSSGGHNVAITSWFGFKQCNGSGNLILGTSNTAYSGSFYYGAGYNLTTTDSSNILLNSIGTAGLNNTLKIGDGTGTGFAQLNAAYICGIYGRTPVGTLNVALIDSSNQLGSVASLDVAQGGTGAATLTDHGILLGSGTGAITPLGAATDGQLPIGSTGADPVLATLTAGTGISVTNGAGSITIASTVSALAWSEITDATKTIVVQEAYIANRGTQITFTLPATAAIGTEFKIQGKGAGLWKIAQGAGQQIYLGSTATSSGAGGYLEATDAHDAITLVCITADTVWATEAVVGNITVA